MLISPILSTTNLQEQFLDLAKGQELAMDLRSKAQMLNADIAAYNARCAPE